MFRFLIRAAGLLVFAAAFVALVADGVRSLAVDALMLTPLEASWRIFAPASLDEFRSLAESRLPPYLLDNVIVPVLSAPTFALAGGLGLLLLVVGRPRHRPVAA